MPGGKSLRPFRRPVKVARTGISKDDTSRYRASQFDCLPCPLKSQCCPNVPRRHIGRSIHEASRDQARQIATTESYGQSRKDRKKVEILFAHLKRILKLDKLRLRGFSGSSHRTESETIGEVVNATRSVAAAPTALTSFQRGIELLRQDNNLVPDDKSLGRALR